MKSDFRAESFKRKLGRNFFVDNLMMDALERLEFITPKRLLNKGMKKLVLEFFNLGLALIGLQKTGPCCAEREAWMRVKCFALKRNKLK